MSLGRWNKRSECENVYDLQLLLGGLKQTIAGNAVKKSKEATRENTPDRVEDKWKTGFKEIVILGMQSIKVRFK